MSHVLPELPYAPDALEPSISLDTVELHYGKHHAGYLDKLNAAIEDTEHANKSLADIVRTAQPGGIFNNSAQAWNHTFYWNCLEPGGTERPDGDLAKAIDDAFGSFDHFRDQFIAQAVALFGSGWLWLVDDGKGKLSLEQGSNADSPLAHGRKPILTCDVWEHAYYLDYQNKRPDYVAAFFGLIHWGFVATNLASSDVGELGARCRPSI